MTSQQMLHGIYKGDTLYITKAGEDQAVFVNCRFGQKMKVVDKSENSGETNKFYNFQVDYNGENWVLDENDILAGWVLPYYALSPIEKTEVNCEGYDSVCNTYGRKKDEEEYTGGSVDYYKVWIENPTTEGIAPYQAECNDIIEALEMNYAEGNAFKAQWRKAAARQGKRKKGYDSGLYDAEKIVFFGERQVVQAKVEQEKKDE